MLAENVADYAIFVIDAERRVRTWTRGASQLLGYEAEEILGRSADILFTPEDRQRNAPQREVTAAIETGRGEDDRWHLRKDGSQIWVSGQLTPLHEGAGAPQRFAKILRDRTDWKLAEEARRESEGRLQTLLDRLPHGAVYQALQEAGSDRVRFTYVSAGVQAIFGIRSEEVMRDAEILSQCIPEEARQQARRQPSGEPADGEFAYERRDTGQRRWIHYQSAPHQIASGDLLWEGVMLDVTHRKEAELALREQEARLSLALDAGRMGSWHWDIRTNEVNWSPQLEAIHGLAPGTFPGTFEAYQQDMHPEDRERVLAAISEAVTTGKPYHIEYRLVWPDRSVHWIESRGKLFHDEAGQPARMIGVCMEVTARKTIEHDLRFLAEASRSLATLVDYESTLQRVAGLAVPHFADWCAIYLPEQGDKLRQLAVAHVDPSKVELAQEYAARWPSDPSAPGGISEVFRTGRPILGEEVTDELLAAAAYDEEHLAALRQLGLKSYMCMPLVIRGETIGVMMFIAAESGRRYTTADLSLAEDLARRAAIATENARLYAKLQTEGRRKDEFLAMLAHELRNPLASIRSGTDLLSMLDTEGEIVAIMQQQVEHLIRLVDDLMDVSRVMRGKVELRKEPVELSSIVDRAADTMRPMLETHRQPLSISLPAEPVWLSGDPVRLTQIVTNLLNNASKYSETGGRIWLSAELQAKSLHNPASSQASANSQETGSSQQAGSSQETGSSQQAGVLIRIRDEGIGIDAETMQQVFDLFTQAHRSLDRSQGGLGIGLTVVKSLAEGHGGSVAVHSDGANQGSEFGVWLPTIEPLEKPRTERPETRGEAAGLKILIVDDNVPAVTLLSLLLSKLGDHEIFTAHDGRAAIQQAREHRPALILLDIGLPILDGYEVARQLRSWPEFQTTRIVALTGYGSVEDRRRSKAAGFDEHLIKPPGSEDLRGILARSG
ncbi:hybrid sensor histidine kinase/response regulator [Candidatus Laterigemmans baculatus]|uniref:hybrid sensor histidine kinase/response regulator n=1 Tax=Candidatus Laterigemmans baculatus TaxID=2770505 RepID=UPI0013DC2D62|nr:PAS domain-containing protein [Candidatus Laterigemmans baculatus]